ncbi:hypothetical protein NDU88_005096 [Pleurodeles waltl]|uniref:Uncharacterized protein n=1 Tax=Pleurodeles waltl TaxID=8319 RepID=A0AAV7WB21_PLEWA|nr:hypothetical protein NDU88_005096 [Pleurodeles waltl]
MHTGTRAKAGRQLHTTIAQYLSYSHPSTPGSPSSPRQTAHHVLPTSSLGVYQPRREPAPYSVRSAAQMLATLELRGGLATFPCLRCHCPLAVRLSRAASEDISLIRDEGKCRTPPLAPPVREWPGERPLRSAAERLNEAERERERAKTRHAAAPSRNAEAASEPSCQGRRARRLSLVWLTTLLECGSRLRAELPGTPSKASLAGLADNPFGMRKPSERLLIVDFGCWGRGREDSYRV